MDSLLDQDYGNIEIIASDDQSSDKSASILKRYAFRDPRLKVNNNEKNIGAHKNFLKAEEKVLFALCDFIKGKKNKLKIVL